MACAADVSSRRVSQSSLPETDRRYSYTSTASFPYLGARPSMINILGYDEQEPLDLPSLADRLQGVLAPFFEQMQQSIQNFVEIEVRAEIERAKRLDSTPQQDVCPDQRSWRRRSSSADLGGRTSSLFSRGAALGTTMRRSSLCSNPLPQMVEEIAEGCVLSTYPPPHGFIPNLPFPSNSTHPAEMQGGNLTQDSTNSPGVPSKLRMTSQAPGAHDPGEGEQQSGQVCRHWHSKGWCRLGDSCKFTHPNQERGAGQLPTKNNVRKQSSSSEAAVAARAKAKPRKVPAS
eukprot:TRINITY_DN18640_c0_g1_i1.p1 TRINITY_DN18640_c0_g1~~TRINITY_DN18640_c0_g1_i1.p1  ORF type:complete len:305 (-),score=32.01 TRINITY_DN18640_c0_g1_i1:72-935(-)